MLTVQALRSHAPEQVLQFIERHELQVGGASMTSANLSGFVSIRRAAGMISSPYYPTYFGPA